MQAHRPPQPPPQSSQRAAGEHATGAAAGMNASSITNADASPEGSRPPIDPDAALAAVLAATGADTSLAKTLRAETRANELRLLMGLTGMGAAIGLGGAIGALMFGEFFELDLTYFEISGVIVGAALIGFSIAALHALYAYSKLKRLVREANEMEREENKEAA